MPLRSSFAARCLFLLALPFVALAAWIVESRAADPPAAGPVTVHKRARIERNGQFELQSTNETWEPRQSAIIVCDMWDAHHCLNAVRRAEELAPRMNQVLENARARGFLIVHAPSSCMAPYENHPGRLRAKQAPPAANLPADIGEWCRSIPAEERGKYPVDQSDGGEDDDPTEHKLWHERLAGMGRNPRSPWKRQLDVLRIHDEDAISDSGVEIWNLFEQRGIRNVVLLGVHTNMCVLGRPFGLRQMAKNGKNVVLMRDMTDTMYNPQRAPYVTHYQGTELIVEHIEKFVCPTITSADFLGGAPFRFARDRRSILLLIGEDEYKTETTLPKFAAEYLEPHGFQVKIVHSDSQDKNHFPGLVAALPDADVLLVSVRRRPPKADELAAIRAHVAAGKPVVGIRTASHAFSLRNNQPPAEGYAAWTSFDAEVLGGSYVGHHGDGPKSTLEPAPGAATHPILVGVDVAQFAGNGSLYKVVPLAPSTTPVLQGTIPNTPTEPVAWTNSPRQGQSRVFYTSLGHPHDFQQPMFCKFLLHGICWTLDLAPPGVTPTQP